MKPLRFYEHFACAYGTIWILLLGSSFLVQKHIEAGMFGLIGFPIIAFFYALYRRTTDKGTTDEISEIRGELDELRQEQGRSQD